MVFFHIGGLAYHIRGFCQGYDDAMFRARWQQANVATLLLER